MKPKKINIQHLLLLAGMLFCLACTEEQTQAVKETIPQVAKSPFKFYKDLEVRPGLNFEVLSWGKGVDSIGAYQILMSDSSRKSYKSNAVARNGVIGDAWNMDLDNDGNPEIYVQLETNSMLDLNVFEYVGNGFNKINFPSLSPQQKKLFKGNDRFYLKNGDLFRSFNAQEKADSTKQTTKVYQYKLAGNSFSSSEVEK
ncbi:hypothetical protein [Pedobacter sandarakinus]|uniref:hypothetical protein n=1 Tax=Pedobacter sandarakinus TaxID=353156 RepID=UPI002247825F|nr:hypothetical protein [Pedobacter sandarakinus]MCX2575039.1 hypothetical protein [Pedobacter sandarakinus]